MPPKAPPLPWETGQGEGDVDDDLLGGCDPDIVGVSDMGQHPVGRTGTGRARRHGMGHAVVEVHRHRNAEQSAGIRL